jgi:hypothetical protein
MRNPFSFSVVDQGKEGQHILENFILGTLGTRG